MNTREKVFQVEHLNRTVQSPKTNGFCARFNRTLQEEFLGVAYRMTLHESVQQPQNDLDRWLVFDNEQRSHQGYRTQGEMRARPLPTDCPQSRCSKLRAVGQPSGL